MAVVTQTGMGAFNGGLLLEQAEYEPLYFEAVSRMPSMEVAEMAAVLPCDDRQAGNTYDQADRFLEMTTGIPGLTCSNISTILSDTVQDIFHEPSYLCSDRLMVNVRALCPISCGCQLGTGGMTGMFGTLDFGCPQSCLEFHTVIDEWMYSTNMRGDLNGDGIVDDGTPLGICRDASDAELIADPNASRECLRDFGRCLELRGRYTRWYATYVRGILPGYGPGVGRGGALGEDGGRHAERRPDRVRQPRELHRAVLGWRRLSDSLLDGNWTLTDPTIPHPRGLTGCRYLASWDPLSALVGFDLCKPSGGFGSIRGVCPVSCGCAKGMDDCPAACTNVASDDDTSVHNASDTADVSDTATDTVTDTATNTVTNTTTITTTTTTTTTSDTTVSTT
ncbi:unnamed protein product [Prorocentrum cordatum]|uniref:Uncharacterized protein n=1 Tax=Prorocentrum cordatum TaxID=2364126 RepID=A0ABN9QJA4_9DINO|nr:unnamed protein product [Polarella glacialis]